MIANQTNLKQMSDILLSREIAQKLGWTVKPRGVVVQHTNQPLYSLVSPAGKFDAHAYLTENEAWLGGGLPDYTGDLNVAVTLLDGLDFELYTFPMRWHVNIMVSNERQQCTFNARCDNAARAIAEAWWLWRTADEN